MAARVLVSQSRDIYAVCNLFLGHERSLAFSWKYYMKIRCTVCPFHESYFFPTKRMMFMPGMKSERTLSRHGSKELAISGAR